jgi:hypothetical protein
MTEKSSRLGLFEKYEKEFCALSRIFLAVPYKFHNAFFRNLPPAADFKAFDSVCVQ